MSLAMWHLKCFPTECHCVCPLWVNSSSLGTPDSNLSVSTANSVPVLGQLSRPLMGILAMSYRASLLCGHFLFSPALLQEDMQWALLVKHLLEILDHPLSHVAIPTQMSLGSELREGHGLFLECSNSFLGAGVAPYSANLKFFRILFTP